MNKIVRIISAIFVVVGVSQQAFGLPGITGSATGYAGEIYVYSYDNNTIYADFWFDPGTYGIVMNAWQVGTMYYAEIKWTITGTATLRAKDGTLVKASKSVAISAPPIPAAPLIQTATNKTSTSFIATWSSTQFAASYRLDVSTTSNFSSIILGYNNLTVNGGTAKTVSGLASGTTYYYRVRAVNTSGTSPTSSSTSALTISSAPAFTAPSSVTGTSFTANWNSVPSATGFRLDVSLNSSFSNFIVNDLPVNATSQVISNLNFATTYYYRVRAVNGSGTSANSATSNMTTVPMAPVATASTAVGSNFFTANWNSSAGATGYRLDVSTTNDFSSFVSGYQNLSVSGTSKMVTALGQKVKYYYRVRAENAFGFSDNSATILGAYFDLNYVMSVDILKKGITTDAQVNAAVLGEKIVRYAFVDGMGRTIQTVMQQQSPSQADIVQPIVYDALGREIVKYLPYTSGSDGWYKADFVANGINYATTGSPQYWFYQATSKVSIDDKPYAETIVEPSPLNRVLEQGAPGASWQPDATNTYASSDHTVKRSYGTNGVNEVLLWSYTLPALGDSFGTISAGTGLTAVYYQPGELYKNQIKDEQGNEVIEYLDKAGRTVLKRVQAVSDSTSVDDTNYASTYYIYSDFGNLVCVIQPEGVKNINTYFGANSTDQEEFLKRWSFRYSYDTRKRMATKQVPGAGPVYMVYDNRDRLVATQDANQRSTANKYWTFTKYDQLNRPILTGIKDTAVLLTQADMQAAVDAHYAKAGAILYETYVGTDALNMHGYSNKSYPVLTGPTTTNDKDRYLSVTYYDNYSYKATLADSNRYTFSNNHLTGQETSYFKRLTGQVTGTKIKVLDGGVTGNYTWLTTVNYYDNDYRVIQTVSDNYKGGTDRITNKLDFTGKVLKSKATHSTYDVRWKDLVGVTLQGNRIYRSATSASWGTSGAASVEQLGASQNGWVEVNVTDNTSQRMFGLSDSNPDAGINNLDYAVYMDGSVLRVYKNGVLAPSGNLAGATVKGELLRWERNGTNLYLKRNGVTAYTFTGVTTAALMADVSFYTLNGSIANVAASFAATSKSVTRSFTYDHAGRLLKVWHRLDSEDSVLLVKNEYNELGQLIDKKLHSTNESTFKQSVDYAYNIRGWLTKMNESDLSATDTDAGRDLFGMQLGYNDDLGISNTPLYNGNISGIKWSRNLALSDTTQNAYVYSYDPMNRIKTSAFKEKIISTWGALGNSRNSETGFNYDLNGNILALQRNDKRTSGWMDNLTYDYGTGTAQSNKLLTVTDAGDKTKGFVDGSATGSTVADYKYDPNGNLVWDRNKGGTEILTNGSFDNGSTGWTLTNSARLTFTNGEVQVASGAANSTLTQTNPATNKPFLVTIEVERIAGTLNVYLGEQNTNITASGTYIFNFTTDSHSNLVLTPQGTFVGKIKNVSVKGQTVITYNFLNLPEIVTRPGDKQLQYIYDASGRKLRQEVSKNSVMEKTTDYAGEYIYENDTLRFINHEEGRLVPDGAHWEYQYHLKDHLGNVRMTFTSNRVVDNPVATMETANATAEQGEFLYYNEAVKINSTLFDHTNSGATNYATRLTGSATERYGLAKSLSVMPGDTLNVSVFAKYLDTNNSNWTTALTNFMAAIANNTAPGGTFVDGGATGSTGGATPSYASVLNKSGETGTAPKAYLNYLVFDRDFHRIDGGFVRMTTAAREYGQDCAHEQLSKQLIIKKAGYVYLYLSNDNAALGGSAVEVFFDDFTVQHIKSPVVQQDDYYAFGLNFNSYKSESTIANQYKISIKELQDELDLGWFDYGKRMYQPEIGKWTSPDPLAYEYFDHSPYTFVLNNPLKYVDPKGDSVELIIGKPYTDAAGELHPYGHVALRVYNSSEGYDKVYDFGRYGAVRGLFGQTGDGILNVYNNSEAYLKEEQSIRESNGYSKATTVEEDKKIMAHFDGLIAEGSSYSRRNNKDRKSYKLDDYDITDNNCCTVAGGGLNQINQNWMGNDEFDPRDALKTLEKNYKSLGLTKKVYYEGGVRITVYDAQKKPENKKRKMSRQEEPMID